MLQGMLAELDRQQGIIDGLHHQLENFRRRDHDLLMQVSSVGSCYRNTALAPTFALRQSHTVRRRRNTTCSCRHCCHACFRHSPLKLSAARPLVAAGSVCS